MKMATNPNTLKKMTSNPSAMENMMKMATNPNTLKTMTSNPSAMENMMKMATNPNTLKKMTSNPSAMENMMNKTKETYGLSTPEKNKKKINIHVSNLELNSNQKKYIGNLLNKKKIITEKIIKLTEEKKYLLNREEKLYEEESKIINTKAKLSGININNISKNRQEFQSNSQNTNIQSNLQTNNAQPNSLNANTQPNSLNANTQPNSLNANTQSNLQTNNAQPNSQTNAKSNLQTNNAQSKSQTNNAQSKSQTNNIQPNSQTNNVQPNSQNNNVQTGGTVQNELNNIIEKKSVINEKIKPLEENLAEVNIKLTSAQGGLFDKSANKIEKNQDINNKEIIQDTKKQTFMEKIKSFFKSDFFTFIKYYLYFIVLFAIIFYITLRINNNTKNSIIVIETKIFFYVSVIVLFIIINDILETPVESLDKFLYVLLFTLIALYIVTYLVEHHYKNNGFFDKLKIVLLGAFIIFIIMVIYIYFNFQKKDKNIATDLFNCFDYGIKKNLFFTIFLMLYLIIYYMVFYFLDWNSSLTDILLPFILGVMLIFFIFCLIIYIAIKMKIINRIQVFNTFIALGSIFFFLLFICAYIFMSSLGTICTTNESVESIHEQEIVSLLIIASIFTILWLDDSRNWRQIGSIFFIVASIITLYCMFYYSVAYPSTGLMSFWLFIEWLIIIFYRKENSKNSIHYSFMKV